MSYVFLDLKTLSFITMLVTLILSLITIFIWRANRTYQGFGFWTLANVSAAAGFALIGFRDILPDFLTVVLGSVFISGALILSFEGMRKFLGRSNSRSFDIAILGIQFSLLFYVTYIDNKPLIRILINSVILSIIAARAAYELLTAEDKHIKRTYSFAGSTYVMFSVFMLLRAVSTFVLSNMTEPISPDWIQSLGFVICILFSIIWTFSYLMMNNERLQEEFIAMQIELEAHASTDFLTGVTNKRRFFEISENELRRAHRFRNTMAIIMFDIDNFKIINDTHGHAAGDEVLIEVADLCKSTLRNIDVLARVGGEEFAILLPHTDTEDARIVAEYLRVAIEKNTVEYSSKTIKITASFGITELCSTDLQIKTLLDRADTALYEAKHKGRNQVIVDTTKRTYKALAIA